MELVKDGEQEPTWALHSAGAPQWPAHKDYSLPREFLNPPNLPSGVAARKHFSTDRQNNHLRPRALSVTLDCLRCGQHSFGPFCSLQADVLGFDVGFR